MTSTSLPMLFLERVDRSPDAPAMWSRNMEGHWQSRSWRQVLEEVEQLAWFLSNSGVQSGDAVAILSSTRPEWSGADFAILGLGGRTVGIYPSLTASEAVFPIHHANVKFVIVENEIQFNKVKGLNVKIFSIEPISGIPSTREWLSEMPPPGWFRSRVAQVSIDAPATIVYTSGTTGNPKGALLTHRALLHVALISREALPSPSQERSLVFLPLAHILQRFTIYRGLMEDASAIFPKNFEDVPAALAFGKPTLLATVPRMLEKIREQVLHKVKAEGKTTERVFDWAMRIGFRIANHLEARTTPPAHLRLQYRLADRLVFRKVRNRLGGQLRTLISGGAALHPEVAKFFVAIGFEVLEGWGLTETCAPATTNRPQRFKWGSVGLPLPGVEIRCEADGELLVRSPGLFTEYLNDPEATSAAFTDDGFFRTGDVGKIDPDGFVWITDRKKEILITAGGKNIPPVPLEQRLERHAVIEQAVVIGDGRPYLTALIVATPGALSADVAAAVASTNAELASFESIKRFTQLPNSFSSESGELTPTLKLKRRAIQAKYHQQIEEMYR